MQPKNNKVLFIVHFPPPVHGSSLMGLQIKGNASINESFDCRFVNLSTSRTLDEIGKNALGKLSRYFGILFQVLGNLLFHRPNLCYFAITAEGPAFYKDTVIIFLVKLLRVKLVYHFQNKGVRNSQDKPIDNLLYRFVFNGTNVILLSPQLYTDIQKYVQPNFVHYCPNCPDGKNLMRAGSRDKGPDDTIEILFLGNMIVKKGVFIMLDACKLLWQKNIPFHCTFVGGWGDISEPQLKERIEGMELAGNVDYVGKKHGDEKNAFLSAADIFAFPTYYDMECFPLVLLEAMQAGLPVISTFEGGIRDIIVDGETGFLVPQKDALALADKLEQLIFDKALRKSMGERGRIRYEENFTLKHFENNLTRILNHCLLT